MWTIMPCQPDPWHLASALLAWPFWQNPTGVRRQPVFRESARSGACFHEGCSVLPSRAESESGAKQDIRVIFAYLGIKRDGVDSRRGIARMIIHGAYKGWKIKLVSFSGVPL